MKGKLIVFEGVEGCGKTTQLALLQNWLAEHLPVPVVVTREPGGTQLGMELRQILLEPRQNDPESQAKAKEPIQDRAELLLYAADRAQHIEGFLKPHLSSGTIVLCDRYVDSTIAYQGYGRGLSLSLIEQINQLATGGLESDLTFWLDVDVEIGLARAKSRGATNRLEQENIEFHQRVRQGYRELAQANPTRIFRVDASASESEVAREIRDIFLKMNYLGM
ncbi:MAG: dTMP kinase [Oscillatoria sp. SIO1A7]|nr:dTMP kinase [Oscillatoria sp. SIO1A7]